MLGVKEAVQTAKRYVQDIYEGEQVNNLLLEEAILDDSQHCWLITFGYDSSRVIRESLGAMATFLNSPVKEETLRDYKTFMIDAENGEFKGMKMRDV